MAKVEKGGEKAKGKKGGDREEGKGSDREKGRGKEEEGEVKIETLRELRNP